ncbi:MAG TPA: creatininase family protein [Nitrososphaeraceae archaeon]|nr:creatininase family protein [Nitrososphaeraceae archaeon]
MIPKNGNPILWEELTWKDVDKLTKTMNMAIIPTAACEQHGPHLPLAVDTIDCYEVAKRVSAKTGVPVVPPLTYGCSQSHGNFPGTLSLRPDTMMKVICEISEWLYRSRIRKILILNGHMWNWGPIYSARENLRYDFPELQVRVLNWWETTPTTMSKLVEDCPVFPSYIHANLSETSCVLAARPELVNMREAVDEDDYETFFEYRMDQYSKSGVVGRGATKSTPELGEKLFTMVVDALVPMVKNALNEERSKSKSAIYENHNNNNNDKSKTNPSPSKGKRKIHNDYDNIDFENSNSGNLKKKAK